MILLLLIRIELRIKKYWMLVFLYRIKYALCNCNSGILPMKFDTLKNKRALYELLSAKRQIQWKGTLRNAKFELKCALKMTKEDF
jgi:hypothetical protein